MYFHDSTDDSVRGIIEEFGRHRLTDVLEEENEEDVFRRYTSNNNNVNRKRYSSIDSTASSLDALWDTHHRRLSEAGLSRHSDSSAVLTEDTDSFIIGQRVWVSGSKPGHIAFIGETQFAPGEWAGIALDEPIGKNDGSVGGTRYFQCEPKKGVFSRLTRLTRVPLEREGMGSGETYATTPSPVGNGYRRSPISPTGSTKGLFKIPMSVGGSTASLMSSASHVIDYRIGDRVIIKSGQGSKVGTVRFMGTAEFAPGEWVGVELDDPRGKNDGAVNGVRYFECQPNYGLFAPVSKVSKSPSKVKPGSCQVHTGGPGLPPSGIKRAGSKESMSNMSMTSAASSVRRVRLGVTSLTPKKTTITTSSTPMPTRTALQDVLKEKQQHIEHLLKERDMERAEITRAASLADEAEQKLTTLRQEYDKYRAECENKLKEHLGLLNKLKEDRNELVSQLDEEKRKNEDLQFRIEESSITKEDIELSNENHIAKIKELEEQLSKERDKVDNLETEAYKLFEAEENLIKSKEETELLRKQIQEARNREHTLEGASATTTSLIASLEKETDQYKIDLDEKNETISVLRQEVNQLTMQMKKQLEESTTMKTDLEALCSIKEKELSNLKEELSETNNLVKEKIDAVTKITSEKLGSEATLEKEVDRLKMDLSAKISDLEISSDSLKAKELEMENMRKEYDSLNEQLKKIDIGRDELVKDLTAKIQEQDKTIEEITKTNNDLVEGTDVLKNELQKIKTDSESSRAEMENNFEKTLAERDIKLKEMSLEIQQKNEETLKNIDVLENFKMEFERKRLEFEETKTALEAAKKETDNIVLTKNTEISQISESLKAKDILIQTLQTDLQKMKTDSESSSVEMKNNFEKTLAERDTKLQERASEIQQKNEEMLKNVDVLDKLRVEFEKKSLEFEEMKAALETAKTESDNIILTKNTEISQISDSLKGKDLLIQTLQTELQTTKVDLESVSNNLVQYQTNLSDVESNLKMERDEIKELLKTKIVELEEAKSDFSNSISQHDEKLSSVSSQLMEKTKEYENSLKDLEIVKENNTSSNKSLTEAHEKQLLETEKKIAQLAEEVRRKDEEIRNNSQKMSELDGNYKGKQLEIENIQKEFEQMKQKYESESALIANLDEEKNALAKAKEELEAKIKDLETVKEELEVSSTNHRKELVEKTHELQTNIESVKEKNGTIEALQNELSSTKEKLLTVSEDLNRYQGDMTEVETSLKKERDEIQAALLEKSSELEQIQKSFSEKLTNTESSLAEATNIIATKTEEVENLKEQLTAVNSHSERTLKDINDNHKKEFGDMEIRISDLLTDLENKDGIISTLSKTSDELKNITNQKCVEFEKLKMELEQSLKQSQTSEEKITELSGEINSLSAAKEDISKQLRESQNTVLELSANKEKLDTELNSLSMTSSGINEKLGELNLQLKKKDEALENTKKEYQTNLQAKDKNLQEIEQLAKDLRDMLEKQKTEYETKIKSLSDSESQMKKMVEQSNREAVKVEGLQNNLKNTVSKLTEKEAELNSRNQEVAKLREDLKKASSKEIITNGSGEHPEQNSLLEEKLMIEGQVAFLNSIIVDMQKKNEEQKARIEILEMGYNSSAADELANLGFTTQFRQPAPRMYCDICEEFDIHETEDCPTQAEDGGDMVSSSQLGKEAKEKPSPRPYCETCEVFGHSTEDCTDQEF